MQRQLRPNLSPPRDFESFWSKTSDALSAIDPELRVDPDEKRAPSDRSEIALQRLAFNSLANGRIHAYLLRWRDTRPRPLVVHSHGYGSRCAIMWDWAQAGVHVLGVDIRGFGRSREALSNPSPWGYMLTGIESPETYFLRGAVCDYMQAAHVGTDLLGADAIERTVFHGISFAGGLALMANAVHHTADLLAVGVPTFGWAEGRRFFVKSGSGHEINSYLSARPDHAEDVRLVLSYFDPMNFAGKIRCPTLVGVGLSDDVVPAHTVYAIANHLGGPHEIMEFPVSHTERPEEQHWTKFEAYWLRLALGGIPADFASGGKRRIHESPEKKPSEGPAASD